MKRFMTFVILALMAVPACRKKLEIPSCIQSKIEEASSNPGLMIVQADEFLFNGKTVYLFSQSGEIADNGAIVYDASCNQLCFLGGIGGLVNCEGIKFHGNAVFRRTIWKR